MCSVHNVNTMNTHALLQYAPTADSCTFAIEKVLGLKTIVVVHLISHKQQFTQQDKVVFKAASLLQRCLNLRYGCLHMYRNKE